MSGEQDPETTLPPALQDQLFAVLFGDRADRERAFAALLAAHPAHAEALCEHLRSHQQLEHSGTATDELAAAPGFAGYRLLSVLGEGGMGTVYKAEQLVPVHRLVAVKVIKQGMDSKAVLSRFEQERQALAAMDHDAIARVYDCGANAQGQPFFAMELVEGLPLHRYCDVHRLSLQERIGLFQQVCAGVQHAHQKGVIHRDLKPGNVLVTNQGGRHAVKIIDFGVARATDRRLAVGSLFTEAGMLIGTPEYMSPEQASGDTRRIDTRTDVYSLGVILYELLVGVLPFSAEELRQAGLAEAQRKLREDEPPKPSTRWSTLGGEATTHAAKCQVTVEGLRRELSGDLDWVILRAMAKEPERRYASATALADDLARYLAHEPLQAGPPSPGYRLRKYLRRHRGPTLAAGVTLLALLGGGIATFAQYLRAEDRAVDALQQKERAEAQQALAIQRAAENEMLAKEKGALAIAEAKTREVAQQNAERAALRARELEQVLVFQSSQWAEVDTEAMGLHLRQAVLAAAGQDLQAQLETDLAGMNFTNIALGLLRRDVFDRSLAAIARGFDEQPLVKAGLLQAVADPLRELGLLDGARAPQTEALEIRRQLLGNDHPDTQASVHCMAMLLFEQGDLAHAEPLFRGCLQVREQNLGRDHHETLNTKANLGFLLQQQGELSEAEQVCHEVLAQRRQTLGDDHPDTMVTANYHGAVLTAQGRHAEAELIFRDTLARARRVLGGERKETLSLIDNLASLLSALGERVEAEQLYREALAQQRRILGDEHPQTLNTISNLGQLLVAQGKLEEAAPLCREALAGDRRILGDDHPNTLSALNNMGLLLLSQGKDAEGAQSYAEALDRCRRTLGDDHPTTIISMGNLATTLAGLGRFAEAEPLCRESVERARRVLGADHPDTLHSIHDWGLLLLRQHRLDAAEPLLREALAGRRRVLGDDHPSTLISLGNLASLLRERGMFADAEPLQREVLERSRQVLGEGHPTTLSFMNNLGTLLQEQGKFADAEPLIRSGLQASRNTLGDHHPDTRASIRSLCNLLEAQGRFGESTPLRRELLAACQREVGDEDPATLRAIFKLGSVLVAAGRHGEAVALLATAEPAARRVLADGDTSRLAAFLMTLGRAQAGLRTPQEFAAAEGRLLEASALFAQSPDADGDGRRDCARSLVELYDSWNAVDPRSGHDKQAVEWRAKLAALPPEPGRK